MDINEILSKCDYTLLDRKATFDDIKAVVDDGIKYGVASVCIPPCFVDRAKQYAGKMPICTVIGFPNGYSSSLVKRYEAEEAIRCGADEIDFVINTNELKAKNYAYVLDEIIRLKEVCGKRVLKVIVETCLLTYDEKIKMCELVKAGGADYIKTSTGFSTGGAVREDIALMHDILHGDVKIKASGGIKSLQDAQDFIALGADRIGTSGIIKAVKEMNIK